MRTSWKMSATALVIAAVAMVSYQNCSVRRLSGAGAGTTGGTSLSTTGGSGGGTSTTGGGTTGTGPGTTVTAKACLIQPDTAGTIMGITGQPPIKTGMGLIQSISQGSFAQTSLALTFVSDCASKSDLTTPQKCPTGTPVCDNTKKSFSLSLSLTCASMANATTCSNFTQGQVIDLSTATTTNMTLSASNTAACKTDSYLVPFTGTKAGKITVMAMDTLAAGKVWKLKLEGVKMAKGGTDMTNTITVDGVYSAEIVTIPACTN